MAHSDRPILGMILKGYPRISETFISNEIYLLEQLGFTLHLFSMRKPRENFSHASVKRIKAGVDYLPETLLLPLPKLLFHSFQLHKKAPKRFNETFRWAIRRFFQSRKAATVKHFLQAGYLVNALLPGRNIAHLHAHFAHSPTSVAMFAGRLSGLPFSFTAHAKDIYTSNQELLADKLSRARFVITCTEYNRRHLSDLPPTRKAPICRIYHGIDVELFSGHPEKAPPSPPYRLLTVARLTRKKGLPSVLQAVRILCDKGFPVQHTLIGDGEERRNILTLIQHLRLDGISEWLGTQPHGVVLDHYRRADLFVLGCEVAPNGDRDGIPNVILESMAMGVPVVSTSVSAIPEILEDEKTGLLVSPGQPEALARAMIRLLTDAGLRRQVIPSARDRVIRSFNNRELAGELAAVWRRYLPPENISGTAG